MLMQTNCCGISFLCILAQFSAQGHVLKAIDPSWIQAKQGRPKSRSPINQVPPMQAAKRPKIGRSDMTGEA